MGRFRVRVLSFSVLREIDGAWKTEDFAAMLDAMDYGETSGMSDEELRDMCIMSLQELSPEDAATVVLDHHLGDRLTKGQIRNIAGEMPDDKLWEEHADMSLHERLFNIGSLLFEAFPRTFPEPDAVRVVLEVAATDDNGRATLTRPLHESLLVRLLADGMPDRSVLRRLFDEQLKGPAFPEADTIVWTVQAETLAAGSVKVDVISSGYWLDSLRDAEAYDSTARADID